MNESDKPRVTDHDFLEPEDTGGDRCAFWYENEPPRLLCHRLKSAHGPRRYEIRTVADFMAIPIEKLDDCLHDFDTWLGIQHFAREVGPKLSAEFKMRDVPGECGPDRFIWIDDGKHVATISVLTPDGKVESVEIDTARPPA